MTVEYDTAFGYPTSIFIDNDENVEGDEFSFAVALQDYVETQAVSLDFYEQYKALYESSEGRAQEPPTLHGAASSSSSWSTMFSACVASLMGGFIFLL